MASRDNDEVSQRVRRRHHLLQSDLAKGCFDKHIENFKKLKTNIERVDFTYKFYISKNSGALDALYPKRVEKNDNASLGFRERGNKMFREKKDLEALLLYTESIAHAENCSSHLGIAYANRSAVLFEKGYYKECLEDIDRALQSHYPNHLMEKLLNRQKRAKILQAERPKSFCYHEPVPNIVNKHPLIPAAADCVELKKNKTFGTHVITTRDVKAGEVISVETPLVHSINTESRFLNCHECLDLCFNMIPCDKCATALYCSTTCKEDAFKSYHRYECDFGSATEDEHIILKTTLLGAMEEYKNIKVNGGSSRNNLSPSDRCKLYDLETNENVWDDRFYYWLATDAGILFHCLKEWTKFLEENKLDENALKDIMFRGLLIKATNAVAIVKHNFIPDKIGHCGTSVASAIYSFFSRYNHSCVPNCDYVFHGKNVIIRAIEDIKKGQQCFISYRPTYIYADRSERQTQLKHHYNFICNCMACKHFWPSYEKLSLEDHLVAALEEIMALSKNTTCKVAALRLRSILQIVAQGIANIDKEAVLAECFELQKVLAEFPKAAAFIKDIIMELNAYSGNKDIKF